MMLNDFPSDQVLKLEAHRDEETNISNAQMNQSLNSISDIDSSSQLDTNSSQPNTPAIINNSTSSSSGSDRINVEHVQLPPTTSLHHRFETQNRIESLHQQPQVSSQQPTYFTSEVNSNYNISNSVGLRTSSSGPSSVVSNAKALGQHSSSSTLVNMNVESTQHASMVPSAHCSDQSALQYSLPTSKHIPNSSPSMALNFSHDLLLPTGHHNHQTILHQDNDNTDVKPQTLSNSFGIDSGSLMESAVGMNMNMNMWKNSMGLNHFKHPAIAEHGFLPTSDMNSFTSWTHGANISHQSQTMTHHILDGQHLIGYPQHHHQRSLPIPNQDIVGASLKGQACAGQASFMLNSINHQASTSQNSNSAHHAAQTHDNLNLTSQPLDHSATSCNLTMNDNQFYNSSRTESRSHPKAPVFVTDRPVQMTLTNHASHLAYHNATDHTNQQPTTSHHVAGSSSSTVNSKNIGTFRCPHCSEIFSMRNLYQSHLKTHSQEKGSKAKFQCELCAHEFSQKTSLNRHMKSHTGERPFPCEICGKAFSEKERLKIHMRTHTGEKPFTCEICGKSFSQKSTVKRHQTVHTGEKKFKCDCGKGFANRGNLIAHIKTKGSNHFE